MIYCSNPSVSSLETSSSQSQSEQLNYNVQIAHPSPVQLGAEEGRRGVEKGWGWAWVRGRCVRACVCVACAADCATVCACCLLIRSWRGVWGRSPRR